jgi:hypothetical protein
VTCFVYRDFSNHETNQLCTGACLLLPLFKTNHWEILGCPIHIHGSADNQTNYQIPVRMSSTTKLLLDWCLSSKKELQTAHPEQ